MADEFYSTAEAAIKSTGTRKEDFGFTTDQQLTDWIEARLVEIKDMIDRDRNRDYHAEAAAGGQPVPPGIHGIALRMMSNHIGHAILRRTTPIIRVDDFSIKMIEDQVFTTAIKKDLKRYPKKLEGLTRRLGIMVMTRDGAAGSDDSDG